MSELEQLEERIAKLSQGELARFREWFAEFDARLWDAEIERDGAAGKLDEIVAEGLEDYRTGKVRKL